MKIHTLAVFLIQIKERSRKTSINKAVVTVLTGSDEMRKEKKGIWYSKTKRRAT